MATEDELLAEIRRELDAHNEMNMKLGTCGACKCFNVKSWHDNIKPDEGRCCGWSEIEDDIHNAGYVSAASTCERYRENTSHIDELRRRRPHTEKALLSIRKRNLGTIRSYIYG